MDTSSSKDLEVSEVDPDPFTPGQKRFYTWTIIGGALAAAGAAIAMVCELCSIPNLSMAVLIAYLLVLFSWLAFFIAAVWFAYVVQFKAPKETQLRYRHGAWRHVGYQIAVFMILALSLRAFGIHGEDQPIEISYGASVAPNKSTPKPAQRKTAKVMLTASELAAIMILFALAELAALLGKDVAQATDEIDHVRREAIKARQGMENVRSSLQISESAINAAIETLQGMQVQIAVDQMHTDLKKNVLQLLKAWSARANHHGGQGDEPLPHLVWRVFLENYVLEEESDFKPEHLQTEGVPIAAQPYPSVERPDGKIINVRVDSVAYVATNVGFYATFLEKFAEELANAKVDISMAVLTTVLPAYWWNWPRSTGRLLAYPPIGALRSTMAKMDERVRTDRLILVRSDPTSRSSNNESPLEDAQLLERMEGWFVGKADDNKPLPCSSEPEDPATLKLKELMPVELRESLVKDGGAIHPVFERRPPNSIVMDDRTWDVQPLIDEFMKLHKGGGAWALPVSNDFIASKMKGRYDFTFIGTSGRKVDAPLGAWNDESIRWKFCIMTSISDKNETMFMTLIEGEAAEMQMTKCREHLKHELFKARPLTKREPSSETAVTI